MAILYRTNCRDKAKIQSEFSPFAKPDEIEGMIIGNDLDSLLSAAVLKTKFNWDIIGVYDYSNLWYSKDTKDFKRKVLEEKFVAIDLDIYHPNIPSLGHHILEFDSNDILPFHCLSLNPNFIRGISLRNFKRKYPLGTVHFLIWLFDVDVLDSDAEILIWLADSSFINGQIHRFKSNVNEWISSYLSSDFLVQSMKKIDTKEFENNLQKNIISGLKSIKICGNSGQVRSRHNLIRGFQCQWYDPNNNREDIDKVMSFICRKTGWEKPILPGSFNRIKGIRKNCNTSYVKNKYGSLDKFLEEEAVFSYVMNFYNNINYTTNISF